MNEKKKVHYSKFLSLVLRHNPSAANVELDESGYVKVVDLLEGCKNANHAMTLDELKEVVATNDKKRFEFNGDETLIRASQGHSVSVDLGYKEQIPPDILYHGTVTVFLASIMSNGLEKRERQHVHLSDNKKTAYEVGSRRAHDNITAEILKIDAKKMYEDGYKFYLSTNGVWLTDYVPTEYISISR